MHGPEKIVVDTVERIQGQERELVIISLTTSDPGHAAQRADFYFQPNRLNVAITRPKVKRIVVGSPLLFKAVPKEKKLQEWVEHFRALYQQSYVIVFK
jgi:DNA replication ATP-dependent helicase Dna2